MYELRDQSVDYPGGAGTQITSAHREWLDSPYPVAYFDRRWNYLIGIEHYHRAFPGMAEVGNIMRWYFDLGPQTVSSKDVMVQWEIEARANTAWFKGLVGKCRTAPWALQLLDELESNADFRRF
jgi:hypothetical protein